MLSLKRTVARSAAAGHKVHWQVALFAVLVLAHSLGRPAEVTPASQRGLAEILYLVRRWAHGSELVPESKAGWLERLVGSHKAAPLPTGRR